MRLFFFEVLIITLLTGCSASMQKGALIRAYDSYNAQDYVETLKSASRAELHQTPTPELRAEILFLKAMALEKLYKTKESKGMLMYIVNDYPTTQYGFMARTKLQELQKEDNNISQIQEKIQIP